MRYITAFELIDRFRKGKIARQDVYLIHRGQGDHDLDDCECWCDPLVLDYKTINLLTFEDLEAALRHHYRTH